MPSRYRVEIIKKAEKEFLSLTPVVRDRMRVKILSLEDTPRPSGCKRLKDSEFFRIRVGEYRLVYSIDNGQRIVKILSIAHRKDVYR